ncbi:MULTISPECIES: transposase [Collinsella]|uniref:transposase n=1 Tax=Collinsella TaxID=102106 RepID=UPI0034A30657|nr:hypothetical protein [Collinsella aerofaciens]
MQILPADCICQLDCELRGLRGVRMFTGDKAVGMVGSLAEMFPGAKCRRCAAHFIRIQWSTAPAPCT